MTKETMKDVDGFGIQVKVAKLPKPPKKVVVKKYPTMKGDGYEGRSTVTTKP